MAVLSAFNAFVLYIFFSFLIKAVILAKEKDLQIIIEEKPSECDGYARPGDVVHVHFTGMLKDGHIFDASRRDGRPPFKFQLGSGNVIKGWERGLHGMCPGEKRKLVIPPHLGYGKNGIEGVIPPDATLLFQVQLVGLERQSPYHQIEQFLLFSMWPIGILSLLYYLYRKITASETEQDRKSEKKWHKKKR